MTKSRKQAFPRVLAIVMTAVVAATAVSCTESGTTDGTTRSTTSIAPSSVTTGTTTLTPTSQPTTAGPSSVATSTVQTTETGVTGAFSDADLALVINGKSFELLSDAAPLLNELGSDFQKTEAVSCVYDGFDKTFDYGFLQIYTIPKGQQDLLDGIYLLDDRYQTARGIKVGAAKSDVIAAYGEKADNGGLVYNKSGDPTDLADPSLTIVLENDRVTAISYYSGSNVQGAGSGG